LDRRRLEEKLFKALMIASTFVVVGSLFALFSEIVLK
jgi:hypothetical protein